MFKLTNGYTITEAVGDLDESSFIGGLEVKA